jgi:hypothetical protein
MSAEVLPSIRPTFRAVAATVIPETTALDASGWATLEAAVERALAARPEPMRRQLALFVRVLEYLPLFTEGGRFSRLGPMPRHRVLKSLESSRSLLVRRGVWGLRTLVLLGYYSQPEIQARIGYRAHPDGWSARRQSAEHPATSADA